MAKMMEQLAKKQKMHGPRNYESEKQLCCKRETTHENCNIIIF